MLRTRLLFLVVAFAFLASASWADDLGYIDCSQYPDPTQVLDKAGMTTGVVAVLPCGEHFTILVRGEFYSQIKTKDGKVGYILTYLITPVASASPKPQSTSAPAAASASNAVSAKTTAANDFKIISPKPVTPSPSAVATSASAEQPAPAAPASNAPASTSSAPSPTSPAPQPVASASAQTEAPASAPASVLQPQAPAQAEATTSAASSASSSSATVEQPKPAEAVEHPAVASNPAASIPATVQPNAAESAQPEAASPAPAPSVSTSNFPPAESAPATMPSPAPTSAATAAASQPQPTPPPQTEIPPSPTASATSASPESSPASAASPSSAATIQPEPPGPAESQPVPAQPAFNEPQIKLKQRAPRPFPEISSVPMFEAFAGYGFTRFGSGANGSNLNGALGSFAVNFMPWLQIIGDASYNFVTVNGTKSVVYGDHFGPRIFLRSRGARGPIPFVEGLIGGTRIDTTTAGVTGSDNGLSYKAGGGVDLNISHHLAVRLVDADYYRIPFLTNSQTNYSASVGIVFRFGSGRTQ